jgi:hypothetical protein
LPALVNPPLAFELEDIQFNNRHLLIRGLEYEYPASSSFPQKVSICGGIVFPIHNERLSRCTGLARITRA